MATIFDKIIAREIPADIVFEDDLCLAFRDVNPQAPVHVLLIPKKPIVNLADATPEDRALLGHLMLVAPAIAEKLGVGGAFRLNVNNGAAVGQSVFHLHVHIIPRWDGVALRRHSGTMEDADVLKAHAAKIVAAL
jgi:histidine triad (HIT) family protein